MQIAFKNQPLPFHDNAQPAAEAALAANEQGKFWEMHDKLFANQQALDRPSLEKYAQELGLDMGKFKAALDSRQVQGRRSTRTRTEGTAVGANGTPDLLHQRHPARRRPAGRRVQDGDRRGAEEVARARPRPADASLA